MLEAKTVELLKELKQNKFDFSKIDPTALAYELIESIGDKDGEIRDGLIYPVLAHLLHDDVIDRKELVNVTKLLITDRCLFFDMKNEIEYSVLTRSFTTLQLAILMYKHNQLSLFSDDLFNHVVDVFINYYENETDFRGYEEGIGWLHSIAHAGDMFTQIVKNESISNDQLERIFDVVKDKFKIYEYMFVHDEDERTIHALENAIKSGVMSKKYIMSYIDEFSEHDKGSQYPEAYNIMRNVKCFLRSLYFRFIDDEEYGYISEKIKEVLQKK